MKKMEEVKEMKEMRKTIAVMTKIFTVICKIIFTIFQSIFILATAILFPSATNSDTAQRIEEIEEENRHNYPIWLSIDTINGNGKLVRKGSAEEYDIFDD